MALSQETLLKPEVYLKLRRSFLDGIAALDKFWSKDNPGVPLPVDPADFEEPDLPTARMLQCQNAMCGVYFESKKARAPVHCANCEVKA